MAGVKDSLRRAFVNWRSEGEETSIRHQCLSVGVTGVVLVDVLLISDKGWSQVDGRTNWQ